MKDFLLFQPPSLSAYAHSVDMLLLLEAVLVGLLILPVFVLITYFAIRYRAGATVDRSRRRLGNVWVESSWALVPFLVALVLFFWAAQLFLFQHRPPANAMEIQGIAKQWMWKFQHPGGQREINTLHVPINEPIKLVLISQDVIHSLFLPALRIKQDVLPGRYTSLWFEADEPGEYYLLCSEYCGTSHSEMRGSVVAMEPAAYDRWLETSDVDMSLAERGKQLYHEFGCSGCHENSDVVRAPSFDGLYGSPVPLASGKVVTADDGYIRDSILYPKRAVAAGYQPVMPSFEGKLDEGQILELVAYIKSLANERDYRP